MSAEDFVLAGLVPEPSIFANVGTDQADAIDRISTVPCPDHGHPNCAECCERVLRAKEVAEARRKESSGPSAPAIPSTPELQLAVPKPPTTEAPIVTLAKEYSGILEQIQRNEKLLIGAQERVAFLLNSISESKLAAETARLALVKYATTE